MENPDWFGHTLRRVADSLDRAEVSRRLKAARWLAGSVDEKGKPTPLSPQDLARDKRLIANKISANAIMEFEQTIRTARPMELRELAFALGVGPEWFAPTPVLHPAETRALLQQLLDDLDRAGGQAGQGTQSKPDDEDHPDVVQGDGGA